MGIGITSNKEKTEQKGASESVSIPNGDRHYLEPNGCNADTPISSGFNPQWG